MAEVSGTAPLWDALVAYKEARILPFHTPGHKLRPGIFNRLENHLGAGLFAMDPSDEIISAAHDHQFERVLEEAQCLAAAAHGAAGTLFLTNGTTGGLHAALLPLSGNVLVPRFSHQSVYSALALSDAQPVYLPAEMDARWHWPLQPSLEQWQRFLDQYAPRAVVVTYPTYYGMTPDLPALVALGRQYNCEVIVDEAHGAHFGYHPLLPPAAMHCGADISIQSTHKTMGALTGSSMLHCRTSVGYRRCQQALQFLQTTSPSLVALAVLDEVRRVWQSQGKAICEYVLRLVALLRDQLAAIPQVLLAPEGSDPTKILFSLERIGMTGQEVERALRERFNIQMEMSDTRWVLALITLGDSETSVCALAQALRQLCQGHAGTIPRSHACISWPDLPTARLSMGKASFAPGRPVALSHAAGKLSADFITPYPPGVPLLVPGELWNQQLVEYVQEIRKQQWYVRGVTEEMVWIVEDSQDF